MKKGQKPGNGPLKARLKSAELKATQAHELTRQCKATHKEARKSYKEARKRVKELRALIKRSLKKPKAAIQRR